MTLVSFPKDTAIIKGENNLGNWVDYETKQLYRSSKDQPAHQLELTVS